MGALKPTTRWLITLAALALTSCSSGETDKAPAAGTEGGACYANGTCNAGLDCTPVNDESLCVRSGGSGGGGSCMQGEAVTCSCTDGTSSTQDCLPDGTLGPCQCGSGGDGGATGTGGVPPAGGAGGNGAGGVSTGGAPATGGDAGSGNSGNGGSGNAGSGGTATGGSGGMMASGGSGGTGCGGEPLCGTWSECFGPQQPFNNCNEFCSARGELCAACGENGEYVRGWSPGSDAACEANVFDDVSGPGDCEFAFQFGNPSVGWYPVRCCCATP